MVLNAYMARMYLSKPIAQLKWKGENRQYSIDHIYVVLVKLSSIDYVKVLV